MSDEVDEIIESWHRELPHLKLGTLAVFSRLARVARLFEDLRRDVFAEHGLGSHEFDVLAALRRATPRSELTPGQLLASTHVTSGTMTNRLDLLVSRKLVLRRPHPDDGRQNLIRLSAAGRRKVDAAFEALLNAERAVTAELAPDSLQSLAESMAALLQVMTAGPGIVAEEAARRG